MPKIRVLCCVLISMLSLATLGQSEELVFRDGDGFTYRAQFMGELMENQQYALVVNDGLAKGFLFFNPLENAFKATIFQNAEVFGYALEGQWIGNGTLAYGANTAGRLYTTQVFEGPASRDAEKSSNFR